MLSPTDFIDALVHYRTMFPGSQVSFGDLSDREEYPEPGGGKRTGSRVHNLRENGRSYLLLGYLNTRPRTTYLAGIRNPNLALVDAERRGRMDNPFHHGGHESEGGHEHAPAPEHGKHARTNYIDPGAAGHDSGYRMSLAVLGGVGGEHA